MYLVKSYQVCDSQDFLSVKYEPYNVPTSKDIKIGAGVELVLTGMLPPCSKTYAQCFLWFRFIIVIFGTKGQKDNKLSSIYISFEERCTVLSVRGPDFEGFENCKQ